MNLTPTTEIEAVNALLRTIGEAPISTLAGALPVDASMARQLLHATSRTLQTKGWAFNVDLDFPLPALTDGTVPVPSNTLSIDAVDKTKRLVIRAGKLYDRANRTAVFGSTVTVNITLFHAFSDLPEYARQFVYISAGRQFQDSTLGDDSLHRFTVQDEIDAWAAFLDAEVEQGDYNVLRDSPVGRIVRRQRVRR